MTLPTIKNYGHHDSTKYGYNTLCMSLANIDLYFSYQTIVAYRDSDDGQVVCENVWGSTTGKHLNWIDGGALLDRKPRDEFLRMLDAACKRHGI